jgi:hypothetical protein
MKDCFNASILVRQNDTDNLSYILNNENDTLEVVFRIANYTDGNIYGCKMKPYTFEHGEVYPIVVTDTIDNEDPRIWLYQGKPYISFTKGVCAIAFGEYDVKGSKKLKDIKFLDYDNNNKGKKHKNWGFFEHNNNLCVVIKPSPLTIKEREETYVERGLEEYNGGSSPVLHPTEKENYIFVHKPNRDYNIWCICFKKEEETKKWKIKGYTKEELNKNPKGDICFVSGAVYDKTKSQWILSGGYNDKYIGFWILKHDYLLSKMTYL